MTEYIGKTLDEIRAIDPDIDDLTWRQICYIVALGMGDLKDWVRYSYGQEPEGKWFKSRSGSDGMSPKFKLWPAYHESGEHSWRVLESLREWQIVNFELNGQRCITDFSVYKDGGTVFQLEYLDHLDLKQTVTKAAAKCILNNISLNQ